MSEYVRQGQPIASWIRERVFLNLTLAEYIKGLITPFNVVAAILIPGTCYVILEMRRTAAAPCRSEPACEPAGLHCHRCPPSTTRRTSTPTTAPRGAP